MAVAKVAKVAGLWGGQGYTGFLSFRVPFGVAGANEDGVAGFMTVAETLVFV